MTTQMSAHKLSPDELEADIARQRAQLAATVNELQAQVQVRARSLAKRAAVLAGAAVAVVVVIKRRRS